MALEQAAAARKAKLIALRERKDGKRKAETNGEDEGPIIFRSYDRQTKQAKVHTDEYDTVERMVDGMTETIIQDDAEKRAQELDLFNIQPRKPNWDLKRDVDKRLEKLQPVTQAAIATLLRRRIAEMNGDEAAHNLAVAVEARTIDDEAIASDDE